jgi:glutaredoxin 3
MADVTIYTLRFCPFCIGAKTLLRHRDISFDEVVLARTQANRNKLERISQPLGLRTFPQVVVNGTPVGGFDRLREADRSGRLRQLLAS